MSQADKLIQQLENAQDDHRKTVAALETQLLAIREELRMTTEHLAKREARLSQIINTANDAFLSTDISGVVSEWNTTAETLFGWPRDEVIGNPIGKLIIPPNGYDPESSEGCLMAILNTFGDAQRGELVGIRRDGGQIPIEVSISVMVDEEAFIFNAFIHDISSKIELQDQLTQAQKLESIGQLAAGIAHEINTPVQYIGDNLEFLQGTFTDLAGLIDRLQEMLRSAKSGPVPEQVVQQAEDAVEKADLGFVMDEAPNALEAALDGVKRISKIVKSMKDFAHPGVESFTCIDLNRAIEATATVCQSEWRYVAELVTDFDQNLPPVPCLPGELNQVLLNIIVNAAQAIEEAPKSPTGMGLINISTGREGDQVRIEISDSGPGIPEDIRSRIFDPFFTTKEVGKGTGQGLAISHAVIVEKHRGQLTVNPRQGGGTTFKILLPMNGQQTCEAPS